jgi:hypothetical protein
MTEKRATVSHPCSVSNFGGRAAEEVTKKNILYFSGAFLCASVADSSYK